MKITSKILFAAVLALGGSVATVETAAAMPLTGPAQITAAAPIEQAGWGCGPGWRMNAWGRCAPFRGGWGPRRGGPRRFRRW